MTPDPITQALTAAYKFINSSEQELDEEKKIRVDYLNDFHRLVPLLESITALRQHKEWMPIESAPKDGTRILCWSDERAWEGVHVAYWGRDNPMNPLGWLGGHCSINHIDQPTHWQPLPAPPKESDDERA